MADGSENGHEATWGSKTRVRYGAGEVTTARVRLNGGWQAALPDRSGPNASGSDGRVADEFVVKIHSRCNLACDYCYMYRLADQSWASQPGAMSPQVVDALVRRISDHARRHRLPAVIVALHGGEPLLAGLQVIDHAARTFRAAFAGGHTQLQLVVQTNGVLLNEQFLEIFREHGVSVGVSLDGTRQAHDRRRRTRRGEGSHRRVMAGLQLLRKERYRHLFGGLLCTVDLGKPPVETYQALLRLEPPMIDFLLPHATWDDPPPGGIDGAYAEWLIAVFDLWYDSPHRETGVRMFDSIIDLCRGGASTTAIIGPTERAGLLVATDGTIEHDDSLKVVGRHATATGCNVVDDELDAVAVTAETLSATCRRCAVVDLCGGGLRAHRYQVANGFDNPAVYCHDLKELITHVRDRLQQDVPRIAVTSR